MRAHLIDPLGPLWRRTLPGWPVPPRDVDVEITAGSIAFRDSLVVRRIRARDLVGASTARTRDGVALSLVTRWRRRRAVTFELPHDADVAEIRHALGIGRHGFGEIAMPTNHFAVSSVEVVFRWLTALAAVYTVYVASTPRHPYTFSLPWLFAGIPPHVFVVFAVGALVLLELLRAVREPGVVLSESYATIRTAAGSVYRYPYAALARVSADARGIRFTLHDGQGVGVHARASSLWRDHPAREEIDVVAAQVIAAAQRAQQGGHPSAEIPLRVRDLAKAESDAVAWFARLDATAASIAGRAYRGAPLDESELWRTVDDADAPVELRAAAARVLARAGGTDMRVKIEKILPRVRVADDERRIRIALDDDVERAAVAWRAMGPSATEGAR